MIQARTGGPFQYITRISRSLRDEPATWSYVSLGARIIIQLGTSAALARILSRGDYGLAAMLGTFLTFLTLMGEMGLNWVTIQAADITSTEVDAMFALNLTFGAVSAVICFFAAPLVGYFYGKPELVSGARLAALSLILSGISVQPLALLRKRLRLKQVFLVQALSTLAGSAISIYIAWVWHSYTALIFQSVITQGTQAALSFCFSDYRPAWSRGMLKPHLGKLAAGGWVQLFQVLTQTFRTVDNIVIGYYCGPDELGLYARAYYLTTVPSILTVSTLNESVVPKLAQVWNSGGDFGDAYRRHLKPAATISLLAAIFMACCAPELIRIQYGTQWMGVTRLLQVMAVTTALQPLYHSSYWLLMAAARFRLMSGIAALNCIVLVAGFFYGVRYGSFGVAAAYGSLMVILTLSTMAFAHASVHIPLSLTLKSLKWPGAVSVVMTASLLAVRRFFSLGPDRAVYSLSLLIPTAALALGAVVLFSMIRSRGERKLSVTEITRDEVYLAIRRLFFA